MKKIILVVGLITIFVFAGANGISPKASAAMPEEACSNIATKIDKQVQRQADAINPNYTLMNPCTGLSDSGVTHQWYNLSSSRAYRNIFTDGTITGHLFQGYMGGKIIDYIICADGRTKVDGYSHGYYWIGAYQEVCNTF